MFPLHYLKQSLRMYKSGNHSDLPYTKKDEKTSQPFHPAH